MPLTGNLAAIGGSIGGSDVGSDVGSAGQPDGLDDAGVAPSEDE